MQKLFVYACFDWLPAPQPNTPSPDVIFSVLSPMPCLTDGDVCFSRAVSRFSQRRYIVPQVAEALGKHNNNQYSFEKVQNNTVYSLKIVCESIIYSFKKML